MKVDKYVKVVLTIIAVCLVWLSIKDMVIGSNFLYGQASPPGQQQKYDGEYRPQADQRWKLWGPGIDLLEERGRGSWETWERGFWANINAGYVPRICVGPTDIIIFEQK